MVILDFDFYRPTYVVFLFTQFIFISYPIFFLPHVHYNIEHRSFISLSYVVSNDAPQLFLSRMAISMYASFCRISITCDEGTPGSHIQRVLQGF